MDNGHWSLGVSSNIPKPFSTHAETLIKLPQHIPEDCRIFPTYPLLLLLLLQFIGSAIGFCLPKRLVKPRQVSSNFLNVHCEFGFDVIKAAHLRAQLADAPEVLADKFDHDDCLQLVGDSRHQSGESPCLWIGARTPYHTWALSSLLL